MALDAHTPDDAVSDGERQIVADEVIAARPRAEDRSMEHADIVVVGGGQSGLAAAHAALERGLRPVVLTASAEPTGSWPRYYDSLRLFSPARYSELPGRSFGGDRDRYPTRDELAEYLRTYAAELDADIRTGHRVTTAAPVAGGGFLVRTVAGVELAAELVIAATGSFGAPYRPSLPGLSRFGGEVIHAAEYRDPAAFADRRVLVVGGGNSAVQIAAELARVARVSITTRSPLKFVRQRPLGRDLHWWLTSSRLDTAPIGPWLGGKTTPVLDDGRYRAAFASGNPDARALFTELAGDAVRWQDGRRERIDAIILATGYRPDLGYLDGTGALDDEGRPLHRAGVSTTLLGLGYVGLDHQRSIASATVRGVGRDAEHVTGRLLANRALKTGTRAPMAWTGLRGRCCPAPAR